MERKVTFLPTAHERAKRSVEAADYAAGWVIVLLVAVVAGVVAWLARS